MWIMLLCLFARSEQILFFGGYRSQPVQMQAVESLVSEQNLTAIAYPSNTSTYEAAIKDGKTIIESWVKRINKEPILPIKIIGHSSGAALAIEVARQVQPRSRVHLVILDGFLPSASFQQNIYTECWAAIDPITTLRSYNYENTKFCQKFRVLTYEGCKTPMCLHFALVNVNARDNVITNSNYGSRAYQNLELPTFWFD